jgi:hypothetical protein
MISRFRIRHVGVAALLAALTAAGVVATQAPASATTPEVALTVSPATVTVGDSVTVTETITNINGFSILGPTARLFSSPDAITGYTTLTSCDAGPGGSCATLNDGNGHPIGYQGILGAALGGGQSATVTFTLAVNVDAASSVETLQGQLFGRNFATAPVNGPTLTVNALADLGVTLTGKPNPGLLSMTLDFTVKVTNSGPGRAAGATYTATATSGLDISSTSTCKGHNNTATCTFGAIPAGGSATAKFSVPIGLLDIGLPFTFHVTRTTSTPTDPNPANDSSSTSCTAVSVLLASCG